jgi:dTMP kinase
MSRTLPNPAAPAQDETRGVLAIRPFRKLWNAMVFSSLGDWLGLLATTALAQQLSGGDYSKANFAIAYELLSISRFQSHIIISGYIPRLF